MGFGPQAAFAQYDVKILEFNDFIRLVAANHPIARQAQLLSQSAREEIRVASSVFDPVLESQYYRKSFKGSNYFTLWENTLRIPLWYGVDVLAGYENNGGPLINPEDLTTESGPDFIRFVYPAGAGSADRQKEGHPAAGAPAERHFGGRAGESHQQAFARCRQSSTGTGRWLLKA